MGPGVRRDDERARIDKEDRPHLDLALRRKNCDSWLPGNFWSR